MTVVTLGYHPLFLPSIIGDAICQSQSLHSSHLRADPWSLFPLVLLLAFPHRTYMWNGGNTLIFPLSHGSLQSRPFVWAPCQLSFPLWLQGFWKMELYVPLHVLSPLFSYASRGSSFFFLFLHPAPQPGLQPGPHSPNAAPIPAPLSSAAQVLVLELSSSNKIIPVETPPLSEVGGESGATGVIAGVCGSVIHCVCGSRLPVFKNDATYAVSLMNRKEEKMELDMWF